MALIRIVHFIFFISNPQEWEGFFRHLLNSRTQERFAIVGCLKFKEISEQSESAKNSISSALARLMQYGTFWTVLCSTTMHPACTRRQCCDGVSGCSYLWYSTQFFLLHLCLSGVSLFFLQWSYVLNSYGRTIKYSKMSFAY